MAGSQAVDGLPGLDVSAVGLDEVGAPAFEVTRTGPNEWLVVLAGRATASAVREVGTRGGPPSRLLARDGARGAALVARVEHDTCGAWVTVANAGAARPVVIRRAGWIDVRGHTAARLGESGPPPADDRVGLGPGDAIVLGDVELTELVGHDGDRFADEVLQDALFDCVGADARRVAERCAAAVAELASPGLQSPPAVVALRVPPDLGDDPVARVEAATGLSRDELDLPGYPLGDLQPDLWKHPPRPPREARFRLDDDGAALTDVRGLLRRLLASWRLEQLLQDGDIELLATEVATNALRHAGTEATVIVRYLGGVVRVEVGDGSVALPEPRHPDLYEEDGRGVALVDALSSSWGVLTTRRGKRVWFEVAVS